MWLWLTVFCNDGNWLVSSLDPQRWFQRPHIQSRGAPSPERTAWCTFSPPEEGKSIIIYSTCVINSLLNEEQRIFKTPDQPWTSLNLRPPGPQRTFTLFGWSTGLYLSGCDAFGLVLAQHGRVVRQVLVHHLIFRVEQQEGLGALNGLLVLLTWSEERGSAVWKAPGFLFCVWWRLIVIFIIYVNMYIMIHIHYIHEYTYMNTYDTCMWCCIFLLQYLLIHEIDLDN